MKEHLKCPNCCKTQFYAIPEKWEIMEIVNQKMFPDDELIKSIGGKLREEDSCFVCTHCNYCLHIGSEGDKMIKSRDKGFIPGRTPRSLEDATKDWLRDFEYIDGAVFKRLAEIDEAISWYESETLTMIESPYTVCGHCGSLNDDDLTLSEINEEEDIVCPNCEQNQGDGWQMKLPYGFPVTWGTLFSPRDPIDRDWILRNKDKVAHCGFYVFQSDLFGALLGVDSCGYDFHQEHWRPLYRARGLPWHTYDAEEEA